MAYMFHI